MPSRLPPFVLAERPLEVMLACVGTHPSTRDLVAVARSLSAHACIFVSVKTHEHGLTSALVPVSVRSSDGGWIARALIRPTFWTGAVSVTVVSLSVAGRPLAGDCLPATLRVGYNHAPAPAGAVLRFAGVGNLPALQTALDCGGSTEEADEVREAWWE